MISIVKRLRISLRRLHKRMVKEPLPPEDIAAGWALGVCIGCAIPFGMQLVISVPLAIMCRISKVGATLGTLISNPVTVFVLYPAQTYIAGRVVFGKSMSFERLMDTEWTWQAVRQLGVETIASFFLGGIFLAIVMTPLTYIAVKRMVMRHRERNAQKKGDCR